MKSASDSILRRIRAKQRGWVFTPKDFIDLAPRNTIGIILYRLVNKGLIRKIGHGLYDFPAKHPKLGILAATPDAIANAIAARSGDIIQPSGAQLANQLGLNNHVPAKPSYITSGNSTRKKIANYPITLNHSKFLNKTPLNINVIKVINALHHLGKNNINDDMITKCKKILSKKDKVQIKKNLAQFPNWMVQFILKINKK
jgi:predicted transcriptional regulator of viral defense system